MAADNVHEFNDANFQAEVESSDKPVLVDFWAEWCMPCRMLSPTIDKLASEHGDKIKVGKVNIDHNQQVSVNHGINAIPTVLIFKGGEVVKRFVGITSEGDLAAAIEELA
ncbi:MAG: thioredoxin [Phycisphaerales bacterium]